MAARSQIDQLTRRRITSWIRLEMEDRGAASAREFARFIGVSHGYLSRVLAGDQTPGLELVLRLTRRLGLSADRLLNEDPPGGVPVAAEPMASARIPPGGPPPATRRIDPERWLARAREARGLIKGKLPNSTVSRLKKEGRP